MSLVVMILIVVGITSLLAPLAKGLGHRLARGGQSPDVKKLIAQLERTEQRLADTEQRLMAAEERLDFQENLLGERQARKLRS